MTKYPNQRYCELLNLIAIFNQEKRGGAKKKPKKEKKEKKQVEVEKVVVEPTEIKLQSPLGGSDIK